MKRILVFLTLILVLLGFLNAGPGDAPQTGNESPWLKVAAALQNMYMTFIENMRDTDRYIPCPSTIPHPHLPAGKNYYIATGKISKALQNAGINEAFHLELCIWKRSGNKKKVVYSREKRESIDLGTFTPKASTNGGNSSSQWAMPIMRKTEIPRQILYRLVAERFRMRIPIAKGEKGTLIFKDSDGNIKATVEVRFKFNFDYKKQAYGKLDGLLIQGNIPAAATFCNGLKGGIRKECLLKLAEALFKEGLQILTAEKRHEAVDTFCRDKMKALVKLETDKIKQKLVAELREQFRLIFKALRIDNEERLDDSIRLAKQHPVFTLEVNKLIKKYYKKHDPQGLWSPELQTYCDYIAGEVYFEKEDYERATVYFGKTGFRESNNRLGEIHFAMGEYEKALGYFEKGGHSSEKARNYGTLADEYLKKGEKTPAEKFYREAVAEYEWLIKSYEYTWRDDDITHRRYCLEKL
ncbi:MAG: tetratricopeptide repeat protein, partial [bacterium]|nr:tetratricopeptide repeat protein [bacterium]